MIDSYKIIEKYYTPDSDIYFILKFHSEQVKDRALEVANKHPELKLDKQFIAEAALLHDIGIFMCNAPRIHCKGTHHYIEHGYLGAELLRSEGLPLHALVCERHTGVGLTKEMIVEQGLPLPVRNFIPQTLEEQVICYADKFYSKSKLSEPHSLEQIRADLGRFGKSQVAVFDIWHQKFS